MSIYSISLHQKLVVEKKKEKDLAAASHGRKRATAIITILSNSLLLGLTEQELQKEPGVTAIIIKQLIRNEFEAQLLALMKFLLFPHSLL